MVKGDDGYETAYCPRCQEAADEIERLRAVLQRCHSVLWFDLRNSLSFGPDYNQAVRDVALAVADVLGCKQESKMDSNDD